VYSSAPELKEGAQPLVLHFWRFCAQSSHSGNDCVESLNVFILIGAFILFIGLLLGSLSTRVGVPTLLVFLGVGMAAGENGIGGIQFEDVDFAFLISNLALAIILLDGGLRTRLETFRVGLKPALDR